MSAAVASSIPIGDGPLKSINTAVPASSVPMGSPLAPATWTATHIANIPLAPHSRSLDQWTEHPELKAWIAKQVALMKPERVYLCDGSEEENKRLLNEMVS
jgi:Phosphoenolpyruvate carboxykinase N-terminal domain